MNAPLFSTAARLDGVSKLYGRFAALRNVTVEFPAGSSTVILGDNGAGKSTLLRIIAGLIVPSRGAVTVFGGPPQKQRGRIAYMSHDAMLYDELSALENLRYFARLQHPSACAGSCTGSPEMALRAVGLDPALTRPVAQYSQGMRQRAALARVLQADPEVLLLDEPFSNLDVASARHIVELLLDFRTWPAPAWPAPAWPVSQTDGDPSGSPAGAAPGRTILLTTHQASLAEALAERTLTLRAGAILGDEGLHALPPVAVAASPQQAAR